MSIDGVLDELFDHLAGTGPAGRRALAEAEDHLHSAAAHARASGLDAAAAERDAVQRFGPPAAVAAGIRRAHLDRAAIARTAFIGTWFVGAVSLVAIGVSGLVAELFGRVYGAGFVAGDGSGVTYTPERCADYFEYVPNAGSCAAAAAEHHFGEVVTSRVAVGVLGLLALAVLAIARRTLLRGPQWRQPSPYVATVLLALFGLAALGLGGLGLMQLGLGTSSGVGADLAAGLVAAIVVLVVAFWSLRRLHRSPLRS
jgi:hypothetical protein